MVLKGVGAFTGVGIGRMLCLAGEKPDYSAAVFAGAGAELARVKTAARMFRTKTKALSEAMRRRAGREEAAILDVQNAILEDRALRDQVDAEIQGGKCAEAALDEVCGRYARMFEEKPSELMRQRAADMRDFRDRMLKILLGIPDVRLEEIPPGSVLAVRELTPSMMVNLRPDLAAIVTERGGKTSHAAIMAQALGIPTVLGVGHLLDAATDGMLAVVDGQSGVVLLEPDDRALEHCREKQRRIAAARRKLAVYKGRPTLDADGGRYLLHANISVPEEAAHALADGAEGIGLLRTEFLFLGRAVPPGEEEQARTYTQLASEMQGRPVWVRTLDAGGDKEIESLGMARPANPFLGQRGIRYSLAHPGPFQEQLRAVLRAGAGRHNIALMLPMVTCVTEVRQVRALLEACKTQLAAENVPFDPALPLGITIETPSAVSTADLLAKEVDFFSLGTNDLTQYILAVDRGNPGVGGLYTPFHPAVLRALQSVVRAGLHAGIQVGLCGAAAADVRMVPLLLAFGLQEFSVSPSQLLATRAAIARWGKAEAAAVADRAMALWEPAAIEEYLTREANKKELL